MGMKRLHDAEYWGIEMLDTQVADPVVHRQRRDPDHRDAHVDEDDHERAWEDEPLDLGHVGVHLTGQAGRRLQSGERDHGNRKCEGQVGPGGRSAQVDRVAEPAGMEHQGQAEHDDQRLEHEVGRGDDDAPAQRTDLDPRQVVDGDERDHT